MKEVRKTSQFKKDYKRFSKDLNKVKLLFSIVEKLAKGEDIPSEFKPHQLKGEWKDFMECHVEDDYLLIWYDKEENIIKRRKHYKTSSSWIAFRIVWKEKEAITNPFYEICSAP
jgi:mRNA interferase YafQ